MKKLSEYENEEALEILADIIEPAAVIFADKEIKKLYETKNKLKIASYAIKAHKKEIIQILAALEQTPIDEYKCNVLTLPLKVIEILNDKELTSFFSQSAEVKQSDVFTAVKGTIEDAEA